MTEETLKQMTKDQAINDLVTPNGKQLAIYHVKNTALYKAAFTSGGELPEELNGMYTDTTRAHEAAKKYVKRRWADFERKQKEDVVEEKIEDAAEEAAPAKRGPGRPKKSEARSA